MKRVFLIVLDSVGIGEEPDAAEYGDVGSNTIKACSRSPYFSMPNRENSGWVITMTRHTPVKNFRYFR